jgi:glucokinase
VVSNHYTLAGWGPIDIREPLRAWFGTEVMVENDANAAALGEWWRGAGRYSKRLATVTVGTGIGVGLLIDGQVQRGADGSHGEAGHQVIDPSGPRCYCGARGCWESLAAGPALARMAAEEGFGVPPSGARMTAVVIEAALAGDAGAVKLVDRVARWIGLGLVNTSAWFTPDAVVVGGGIGTRCFSLMKPTIERVLEESGKLVPTHVTVRAAELGDSAGVVGAAFAALAETNGAPRAI